MSYFAALIVGLFLALLVIVSAGCGPTMRGWGASAAEKAGEYALTGARGYCSLGDVQQTYITENYLSTEKGAVIWIYCQNL